ncbi:hypothetical protein Dimus_025859 [Dionaea muscipula]
MHRAFGSNIEVGGMDRGWESSNSGDAWPWKALLKVRDFTRPFVAFTVTGQCTFRVMRQYMVKDGYNFLRGQHDKVSWAKMVWSADGFPRHQVCLWLAVKNRLLTRSRLYEMGILTGSVETVNHILFECEFAKDVLRGERNARVFGNVASSSVTVIGKILYYVDRTSGLGGQDCLCNQGDLFFDCFFGLRGAESAVSVWDGLAPSRWGCSGFCVVVLIWRWSFISAMCFAVPGLQLLGPGEAGRIGMMSQVVFVLPNPSFWG